MTDNRDWRENQWSQVVQSEDEESKGGTDNSSILRV